MLFAHEKWSFGSIFHRGIFRRTSLTWALKDWIYPQWCRCAGKSLSKFRCPESLCWSFLWTKYAKANNMTLPFLDHKTTKFSFEFWFLITWKRWGVEPFPTHIMWGIPDTCRLFKNCLALSLCYIFSNEKRMFNVTVLFHNKNFTYPHKMVNIWTMLRHYVFDIPFHHSHLCQSLKKENFVYFSRVLSGRWDGLKIWSNQAVSNLRHYKFELWLN